MESCCASWHPVNSKVADAPVKVEVLCFDVLERIGVSLLLEKHASCTKKVGLSIFASLRGGSTEVNKLLSNDEFPVCHLKFLRALQLSVI